MNRFFDGWLVLLLFVVLWVGFLALTGTLSSGYHFTDDHDVLKIQTDLQNSSLKSEFIRFSRNLLHAKNRFRPFYLLHRRAATAVLGAHFTAWSVYFALLAALTSFFLFSTMRSSGFSYSESLLFTGLSLLGPQAAVWWKLGANETLGLFLMSAGLMCMTKSVFHVRFKFLFNALFIFFAVLASWSKESFILALPALVAWKIWLTALKDANAQSRSDAPPSFPNAPTFSHFLKALKQDWPTVSILALVCLTELLHVVRNVGTTGIQYAGYDGFNLNVFLKTSLQSMKAVHAGIILLLIGLTVYLVFKNRSLNNSEQNRSDLRRLFYYFLWPALIAAMLVLPQIVLYMKSGMIERYLLPGVLGYGFLMIVTLRYLRLNSAPAETALKKKPLLPAGLVIVGLLCLQQLRVSRYTALAFTLEGKQTADWFQTIKESTTETDAVLVITDPVAYLEPSVSLQTYLTLVLNRTNTLFTSVDAAVTHRGLLGELNQTFFSRRPVVTLNQQDDYRQFQALLFFPQLEKKFLQHTAGRFDSNHYKRKESSGNYVTYSRRSTEE